MNQKGFANIVLIVVIVILVGTIGYFALIKNLSQSPTKTIDSMGLGIFRSDAFGIEIHYDVNKWKPHVGASYLISGGDALDSKEANALIPSNPPKYYITWTYSNDDHTLKEYQSSGCTGDNTLGGGIKRGGIEIKTSGGISVQGCKTEFFSSDPNVVINILEDLYFIHPLTNKGITIRVLGGPNVEKNRVDEIFASSEAAIATIKFYQASR
ncbi:hypothetical protein HYW53_03600 [Candidatus Giovannonibacteria bacterium]|nr:hypothetical protein [Candidatus Giovannonibacteria bacterium]